MAKKARTPVPRRSEKAVREPLYLAALRGEFGDWAYYVALMPVRELAARVSYADEIHKNKRLAEMIQRNLDDKRAGEILEYLAETKERFFNAIVVGVYGGDPVWHELSLENRADDAADVSVDVADVSVGDFPLRVRGSVGVLQFNGTEDLFALDGQHRLAGLRMAVAQPELLREKEELSVLFVAHARTDPGMERTRRLFTTLNKKARKVTKGEIIALDEDDIAAICARGLVDEDPWFREPRIALKDTNALGPADGASLTTIGNLYDVLTLLFLAASGQSRRELLRVRPLDKDVRRYLAYGKAFFSLLAEHVAPVKQFFTAHDPAKAVTRHRAHGEHLLFRPAGLQIAAECVAEFVGGSKKPPLDMAALQKAVQRFCKGPLSMEARPFRDVMWDPRRRTMELRGRVLARDLLFYMLGITGPGRLQKRVDERLGDGTFDIAALPRI